jgi:hypothetical protein
MFWVYDFHNDAWGNKRRGGYTSAELRVIFDMMAGKADESRDGETIKMMLDNCVLEEKDGKYIPKFAVIDTSQTNWPCDAELKELHLKMFNEIEAVIKKNMPERLQDKLWFYNDSWDLRSYIISAAIKDGYIKIPEDFSKSMVGAALHVKK